ncbi:MAG: energy transducer TonB, partial [Rhodothermaceae bacterium]|nr:energy transducer TonB [Rhodothermaceae bacterium]MXZ57779.1 energy transducer TonB [Rhodothermaceae bacterium]MYB91709.1 energy transducer TonB [Rhodothermaceae bacterium]MYG45516.1 energy transducer TonB [Rhodothermaceae bacterium]MYG70189.1 energy transducer TonB [Rhodothermaceae bacterium]
ARKDQIEGRVIVRFIVDKEGNVRDASITKGIGGGCDEEAIRVLTEHAKFRPGIHQGETVPVEMQIPVVFKLGSDSA